MKKLVNGILIDMTAEEIAQRELEEQQNLIDSKPIASGEALVKSIEKAFKDPSPGETDREHWKRRTLLQKVFTDSCVKNTLLSETCNPSLSRSDFDNVILDLEELHQAGYLTLEQEQFFKELALQWADSVRLEK